MLERFVTFTRLRICKKINYFYKLLLCFYVVYSWKFSFAFCYPRFACLLQTHDTISPLIFTISCTDILLLSYTDVLDNSTPDLLCITQKWTLYMYIYIYQEGAWLHGSYRGNMHFRILLRKCRLTQSLFRTQFLSVTHGNLSP